MKLSKLFTSCAALILIVVLISGCHIDLAIKNLNAPDRARALRNPGDVEKLLVSSFKSFYYALTTYDGAGMMLTTMADYGSSSWGNSGMRDMSSEPRVAWNNDPSYVYAYALKYFWDDMYGAISSANDMLISIKDGMKFYEVSSTGDTVYNTNRNKAWAKFMQGIAYGWLSLLIDKAFLVDEDTDLEGDIPASGYKEVLDFAIKKLNDCINICSANTFTIPDDWAPQSGGGHAVIDQDRLKRLCYSYIARFTAAVARNKTERDAVDWSSVKTNAEKGIQDDFGVYNDWQIWWVSWGLQWMIADQSWMKVDYRLIGPADTSGAYDAWLATDVQQRNVFDVLSYDRRVHPAGDPHADGKYFYYTPDVFFRISRGTYHFSRYNCKKTLNVHDTGTGWVTLLSTRELDLLKAEAELRLGNAQAAADLINKTRTTIGELPAATTANVGAVTDERKWNGSLWAMLKYEKGMETVAEAFGIPLTDRRGWQELPKGTPLQFPIPGAELELLMMDNYTFGGSGEYAAPKFNIRRTVLPPRQ